ncbi:hypothetical protein IFM89_001570 [Coptis chinensis]|uniref:Pentatricopeptide repeat-containing protein n=1 Tax=Coptis chinensis TaxID=261450 RepID=A0A835LWR7_9MAGN|nr:hypothetical protein IFM89_001570 [Coptis chinensis]
MCGFDKNEHTSRSGGHGLHAHDYKKMVMIGDDATDLEVLFIAPVDGKRNPQVVFSNIVDGETLTSSDPLILEDHSAEHIMELKRARVVNTVQRPLKLGSKASDLSFGPKERILMLGWRPDVIEMIREYEKKMFINNARLDLYAKCGDMNVARTIFDEMSKRNVVSWSIMIGGYAGYAGGQILSEDALFLVVRLALVAGLQNGLKPANKQNAASPPHRPQCNWTRLRRSEPSLRVYDPLWKTLGRDVDPFLRSFKNYLATTANNVDTSGIANNTQKMLSDNINEVTVGSGFARNSGIEGTSDANSFFSPDISCVEEFHKSESSSPN